MPKDIQRAVEMIQAAERPLILAGHGVLMSGGMRQLQELADKTQTPVAVTLQIPISVKLVGSEVVPVMVAQLSVAAGGFTVVVWQASPFTGGREGIKGGV